MRRTGRSKETRGGSSASGTRTRTSDRVSLMEVAVSKTFRVALTGDFYNADGSTKYPDIGLNVFSAAPHIQSRAFPEHRKIIGPDQLADANGVIVLTPSVTTETVSRAENL